MSIPPNASAAVLTMPATDSGFFYDFYREKPFTEEDLAAIEKKIAEVVARDEPFVREYEPREEALQEF